ncbi:PaREP1 family protein [Sulfurisphaera ohwakuensis]|uniref:Uncharacterized protein n=1 Tax=Sulfurisphaera ohwakuensis TaxID=69656 RepID=A0A650CKS1_SULOH|nr:hypothetical protein D1869_05315 [Sulfurisphaera ohwakuensis]
MAEEFAKEGLLHNAASKAFQAWKALLGDILVDIRGELLKKYLGKKKLKGRKVVKLVNCYYTYFLYRGTIPPFRKRCKLSFQISLSTS